MTTDKVTFNGKEYKTRDVRLEEYKVTVKVAEEALDGILFDEEKGYSSREAELLDELIYCFVPDELMDAPDEAVAEYIYEKVF